ncbi:amino acid ABC transporter permease [Cryptosporangium aurantiacum]|uniref:Amino acid ABC transporter membrane protein 2, PAAT family n=1 Tax=Cryptosporangium aurantiacum TaxID=134849 RepID=A0A1M7IVM0_9ACTN|nr:amino acid ABC transporter permease [Cryptosporangium aurantiacum]SHM44781.1 amino acid ABC transporter membrane protein 2, PAAT family [Cryptosporangium aurantiacum]
MTVTVAPKVRKKTDPASAVLFDVPGPRARRRNALIGVIGTAVIVGAIGYVIYRFWETGQFSSQKWEIFAYKQPQITILEGFLNTLKAAGIAAILALALGIGLAAARLSDHAWLRAPAFAFVELFRAVPLLLLMFLFYYGTPALGFRVSPLWAVVLGLTLYNGSVFAELFRAGVASVPRGQSEAAYALGLRKTQVMSSVLVPQAVRAMLPAIISQLVVLLKDTALGFLVTYDELLKQLKQLATAPDFEYPLIPLVLVGGAMYIATCLLLSWFATWLERRLSRAGRTSAPVELEEHVGGAAPI